MSKIKELIASDKPLLVDFWAQWCGPCRTMDPIIKEVITELGESVTLLKVNADTDKALMMEYGVRSIPTLILFKGGTQLWRQSGIIPKNEMIKIIKDKIQE